jgi:hypothetical protein
MNKLLAFALLIGAFSFLPLQSAHAGCVVRPVRHCYVHRCYVHPVAYRCGWRPYCHRVYVRRYCRPRCWYPHAVVFGPRCGVRYCP